MNMLVAVAVASVSFLVGFMVCFIQYCDKGLKANTASSLTATRSCGTSCAGADILKNGLRTDSSVWSILTTPVFRSTNIRQNANGCTLRPGDSKSFIGCRFPA